MSRDLTLSLTTLFQCIEALVVNIQNEVFVIYFYLIVFMKRLKIVCLIILLYIEIITSYLTDRYSLYSYDCVHTKKYYFIFIIVVITLFSAAPFLNEFNNEMLWKCWSSSKWDEIFDKIRFIKIRHKWILYNIIIYFVCLVCWSNYNEGSIVTYPTLSVVKLKLKSFHPVLFKVRTKEFALFYLPVGLDGFKTQNR